MSSTGEDNPVGQLVSNTQGNGNFEEEHEVAGPRAQTSDVLQCQFASWYPKFSNLPGRKRANVTIKSVILGDLPNNFVDYMMIDGVKLPVGATKLSSCAEGNDDWSDSDGGPGDDASTDSEPHQHFHFPELNDQLQEGITSFGGAVIPKLNWSAPKDATWVNGGSMKCQTPGDVYVLLKSSDFCLHDVQREAWKECTDFEADQDPPKLQLVLRKWCNLHPSMEFRCFVRHHELLAISQRNHTQHYPHLRQDMRSIQESLVVFFESTILNTFADGQVANYVFDVYLDQKKRVWVLDFNPWVKSTDSLLFEWADLLTLDTEDDPHFRIVETENQVRQDPLASYRAPIDTVDLASMTRGDATNFEEFMKQCQKPTEGSDGSDDEGLP